MRKTCCSSSQCMGVSCDDSRFSDDGIEIIVCEMGCAIVASSECTSLNCADNRFGARTTVARSVAPLSRLHRVKRVTALRSVPAPECTNVTYDDSSFDDDGNANNGCEMDCPIVAIRSCETCS